MVLITMKIKRAISYFFVATIPLMVCLGLILFSFPILGVVGFSVVVAFICGFAAFMLIGSNAWIKAIDGDNLLVLETNSTGIGQAYSAIVKNNPFGGVDVVIDFGNGEKEVRAFDRQVVQIIKQPIKAFVNFFSKKENDPEGVKITLSPSDFKQASWSFGTLTVLFYNSPTGMLLTKPLMSDQEKQMLAEYITLNEWRQLKELNETMRNFTRGTFDLISNNIGKLFANPIVKIILVVGVIVLIIVLAITFIPGLNAMVFPKVAQATGQVVQPIQGALA